MDTSILLGYAGGLITIAAISGYPENFRPTITENPRLYLLTGVLLAIASVALDFIGVWF